MHNIMAEPCKNQKNMKGWEIDMKDIQQGGFCSDSSTDQWRMLMDLGQTVVGSDHLGSRLQNVQCSLHLKQSEMPRKIFEVLRSEYIDIIAHLMI